MGVYAILGWMLVQSLLFWAFAEWRELSIPLEMALLPFFGAVEFFVLLMYMYGGKNENQK